MKRLNDDLTVSPQMPIEALDHIAQAGFKTIICNPPDHEGVKRIPQTGVCLLPDRNALHDFVVACQCREDAGRGYCQNGRGCGV